MEWVGTPFVAGPTPGVQYALVTASLLGIQFVWSIQQVYVNIELLSLGLSKSQLPLIWVASPLCGLLVQPVVGSLSDESTSTNGRRRPFMVWGALLSALGLAVFAWSERIALILGIKATLVAVLAVLVVDVAVNTCQATSRALIVDVFVTERQPEAMAVASVMVSVGHLLAYGMGRLRWVRLGFETRLQGVCILYSCILLICISISATAVKELVLVKPLRVGHDSNSSIVTVKTSKTVRLCRALRIIWTNIIHLDPQLKGIFKVQLFAWYGWFTFLYYGATYAAEVWQGGVVNALDKDELTMVGSFAMFVFSCTATVVACILTAVNFDMINIWILSLLVYAGAMVSTRIISAYSFVLVLFGVVGFSWAVTQWVPFALTSKRIHELPPTVDPYEDDGSNEALTVLNDDEGQRTSDADTEKGGIVLGIHNSALTLPQFVSTFGSYLIYRLMDVDPENPHGDGGKAIATTLQVGAFSALLAAAYAYRLKSIMASDR